MDADPVPPPVDATERNTMIRSLLLTTTLLAVAACTPTPYQGTSTPTTNATERSFAAPMEHLEKPGTQPRDFDPTVPGVYTGVNPDGTHWVTIVEAPPKRP
jgi:hypothetical protein